MKNERAKLYAYGCFMTFILLSLILNYSKNQDVNFFSISFSLPNSTHTNLQLLDLKSNGKTIDANATTIDANTTIEHVAVAKDKCNVFDGQWIFEPEANPLYNAATCPFLSEQVSCRKNGRPDFDYEKWHWESKGCDNLRNNTGKQILEMLRGKRAIIVGDSLNRNQWESLVCMLYATLSPSQSHLDVKSGGYKSLKIKEYDCTVEFYWSPFLVQLELNYTDGRKTLKLDKISPLAKMWKGADIMIFNTGHWWVHKGAWDSLSYKGKTEEMGAETALHLALKTWSRWVRKNVDPDKTRVIFRSLSPEHKLTQWCYNQTRPLKDEPFIQRYPRFLIQTVENMVNNMKSVVTYLNITKLSEYRMDGHPSIYKTKNGKKLIATKRITPERFTDCSHWCLPGLPDTWNRLLFASIASKASTNISAAS